METHNNVQLRYSHCVGLRCPFLSPLEDKLQRVRGGIRSEVTQLKLVTGKGDFSVSTLLSSKVTRGTQDDRLIVGLPQKPLGRRVCTSTIIFTPGRTSYTGVCTDRPIENRVYFWFQEVTWEMIRTVCKKIRLRCLKRTSLNGFQIFPDYQSLLYTEVLGLCRPCLSTFCKITSLLPDYTKPYIRVSFSLRQSTTTHEFNPLVDRNFDFEFDSVGITRYTSSHIFVSCTSSFR